MGGAGRAERASANARSFFPWPIVAWFNVRHPALSSDDTHERRFYRLVGIDAEAGAFIAEYTIG
jgi:hypothetical protein